MQKQNIRSFTLSALTLCLACLPAAGVDMVWHGDTTGLPQLMFGDPTVTPQAGGNPVTSGNTLTVRAANAVSIGICVTGGYAAGAQSATGNTVHVDRLDAISAFIYGGVTTGSGNANGNRVVFREGNVEEIQGSYAAGSGNADDNRVEFHGGNVNRIFGGSSQFGSASGNVVEIRPQFTSASPAAARCRRRGLHIPCFPPACRAACLTPHAYPARR